ncbi:AcrR family transcriptional regulator [Microbacterium resistens]|uniref:AcrR family transcriptional regulator n=1 Tax=Microbacterium resistens TaxID=156977 RepID=A0ABU1SA16_9MICO|nr:TetR/AcrR family transcriptional regulator [Microbacterium resistens]MDR6866421.1 AcrR family transcriptional regulator [Microbacterium resistens]
MVSDRAQESRDRILDATGRVFLRDGGDGVTIAAVAREAGVSKGGLFYHFASKELLIAGLVDRYVSSFDALIAAAGDAPRAATTAYLRSAAHSSGPATQPVVALLAASVVHPEGMAVLRERYRQWQARLDDDGIPAQVAAIVRFAVDGIWLADVLDLAPLTGVARRRVVDSLRELIANADSTA